MYVCILMNILHATQQHDSLTGDIVHSCVRHDAFMCDMV